MKSKMTFKNTLTAGVSYYPDHWPETEWATDLKRIRDAGLSVVRFGEFSWSWFEPKPGVFSFRSYDRFVKLAEDSGLKLLLCTPTASAPPWLLHRYPEARMVDARGRPHDGGRRMVCYNAPSARRLAERALTRLVERYRHHPAVIGWQIDNEPTSGGGGTDREHLFDFNPFTEKIFRKYLEHKYRSLSLLNAAWCNNFWSRAYSSWDEIEAPRRPGIPGLWLEWLRFRHRDIAGLVHWQRDCMRALRRDITLGINIPVCGPVNMALYGQDYWAQAEGMDFVGTDIYCFSRDPDAERRVIGMVCDLMRSVAEDAGAEFWVSETQAGPHRIPWRMTFAGGLWGPDFLRRCTLESVAHGARKIIYFLWRPVRGGQEFGMNGMVRFDGTPDAITRSVPGILAEAHKTRSAVQGRPVALLHYPIDSILLASGYDPDRTANTAMVGWHFMLEDLGFGVKYLNDAGLCRRTWRKGEVLVLPYTLSLNGETARSIRSAIQAGTRVLAGFGTGFFDEYGTIALHCPNHGLDAAFGVAVRGYDSIPRDKAPAVKGCKSLVLDGMLADFEIRGAVLTTKRTDGAPLASRRDNAVYLGFDAGTLYEKSNPSGRKRLRRMISALLSESDT